jgi:hypothetical protein
MKKILLFTCVVTVLTVSGCLVAEGGRHGHGHGHWKQRGPAVIVPAPVVVVPVRVHVD